MRESLTILIQGIVQGVGFRPFVYKLANEMKITGSVSNTSEGVLIAAEGEDLDRFINRIGHEAPPLARISSVDISLSEPTGFTEFIIQKSEDTGSFTLLPPDISICDDCRRELFNMNDRRYLYPFINCINCGPRYSIIRAVPYDRPNTTMNVFTMCEKCNSEYLDPSDRRFHAQPNACSVCGPRVTLLDSNGRNSGSADPIADAIDLLLQGRIIAIKGLGGFHIACDAMNEEAVKRLRELKRKSNKPFALMAPDPEAARRHCLVSTAEEELLSSPQRPVVLLRKKDNIQIPDAVAPKSRYLGFMLPYTPLYYLLFFYPLSKHSSLVAHHCFTALVMTSGNLSEEPIIVATEDAVEKLSGIADAFVVHDRDIFMRVDDSVASVSRQEMFSSLIPAGNRISFIRRSRGYTPVPIPLMDEGPELLGCGADMKNTFTLTKSRYAIVSQHIGDMEDYETVKFFEETFINLKSVYRAEPVAVVHDLHPGYMSSAWAREYGQKKDLKTFGIQHHYAHIGSVMAEHGLKSKVIGVAFDGTGYGPDGTLWGGEFLVADISGFTRAGHLSQVALPGGVMAIKEPWRIALSCLKGIYGDDLLRHLGPTGFIERYGEKVVADILHVAGIRQFSPMSSGAGRIFDAVSALLGICDLNTFEGEASMALESAMSEGVNDDYASDIHYDDIMEVDFSHTFFGILEDMKAGTSRSVIASKFHNTVAAAVVRVVLKLSLMNNIKTVALGGGVFQNIYLVERVSESLRSEGMRVYINESVPCNDAGISLGQAYLAREMMRAGGWQ